MIEDILYWIWLVPLIYLVFRVNGRYSVVILRIGLFIIGFRFGLEWVSWVRGMGSRDWLALLDRTPIGSKTAEYIIAALFGQVAVQAMERAVLSFLNFPDRRQYPAEDERRR